MGQTIHCITDMVSYAGDLRRAAKTAPQTELAEKMQRSAKALESAALDRVSNVGPHLGRLLDTMA
jgi:hypothetical protein